ncbi:MAG: CHAD domain-containing protein, partial [Campylobacterota bacterium]|nr:CHAD domain-containing protein [Campylobacterota bacterium]
MNDLSKYLSAQIRLAMKELKHLHIHSDPENLHQFRVRLRRTISLLKLYRPHSPLERKIKKLLKKTNKIRDLDVLLLAIDPLKYPDLYKKTEKYRNKKFLKHITKSWHKSAMRKLHIIEKKFHKVSTRHESKHYYKHKAKSRYKRTVAAFKALASTDHEKVYHEVRIHFKISRYALNFIQEMQIAKVSKQIKLAKKYQGALG